MQEKAERNKLKILVVGAHPADAVDNAGGTILLHTRLGDEVTVLSLSHGVYSHAATITEKKHTPEELLGQVMERDKIDLIKQNELGEAARILGIHEVVYLRYDDQPLEMD